MNAPSVLLFTAEVTAADYTSETLMVTKGNVDIALVYQWIKLKCFTYIYLARGFHLYLQSYTCSRLGASCVFRISYHGDLVWFRNTKKTLGGFLTHASPLK